MDNIEIAAILEELADLLEIKGSNPFRIRAYRNAVRTIGGLTFPLSSMVAKEEDLTDLPAVGKDISSHIVELVRTGRLSRLEEVAGEEEVRQELHAEAALEAAACVDHVSR